MDYHYPGFYHYNEDYDGQYDYDEDLEHSGYETPDTERPSYHSGDSETDRLPRFMQKNLEERRMRREAGIDSDEEELNDGYGASQYNDNKGIQLDISFIPLVQPEKPRRNAKPTSETYIKYFHEEFNLNDWLIKVMKILCREDLYTNSWICQNRNPSNDELFSLTYTVPRKVTSPVRIVTEADFAEMVTQAKSMQTNQRVKITITELRKLKAYFSASPPRTQRENRQSGSDSDSSADNKRKRRKKRKLGDLSAEEKEQNKIIQTLQLRYDCSDRQCPKSPCFVAGPDAYHVHLTHQHLRLWASVIQSKQEGVDAENLPNNKIFDPALSHNTADISTLARRREAQSRAIPPAPTLSFEGIGELIRAICEPSAQPQSAAREETSPTVAPAINISPAFDALPIPMPLANFCNIYALSHALKTKLIAIDIAGPHVLRLIEDSDLRKEGKLTIGELATLRDAEERWKQTDRRWKETQGRSN